MLLRGLSVPGAFSNFDNYRERKGNEELKEDGKEQEEEEGRGGGEGGGGGVGGGDY